MYAKYFFTPDLNELYICLFFEPDDNTTPRYETDCFEKKCWGDGCPCCYTRPQHLLELMWRFCHAQLEKNSCIQQMVVRNDMAAQAYICDGKTTSLTSDVIYSFKSEKASDSSCSLFHLYHHSLDSLMVTTGANPIRDYYHEMDWHNSFVMIKMIAFSADEDRPKHLIDPTKECPVHRLLSTMQFGRSYKPHAECKNSVELLEMALGNLDNVIKLL